MAQAATETGAGHSTAQSGLWETRPSASLSKSNRACVDHLFLRFFNVTASKLVECAYQKQLELSDALQKQEKNSGGSDRQLD